MEEKQIREHIVGTSTLSSSSPCSNRRFQVNVHLLTETYDQSQDDSRCQDGDGKQDVGATNRPHFFDEYSMGIVLGLRMQVLVVDLVNDSGLNHLQDVIVKDLLEFRVLLQSQRQKGLYVLHELF